MNNSVSRRALILCGHAVWPGVAEGKLNARMAAAAAEHFRMAGYEVKQSSVEDYDVPTELERLQWADVIFAQTPVYWMGVPWQFKKYIDEVFTAGSGVLCSGDGRHRSTPQDGYGTGGLLKGQYLLSVTANAPPGAFGRPDQVLFHGHTVDDLWLPFHANMQFVGLKKVPGDSTFVCHDVMKNPDIDSDLLRFQAHMERLFPANTKTDIQ